MPSVKPMRYAHSDGHTDVCFDDSGKYDCCNHDYVDEKPKEKKGGGGRGGGDGSIIYNLFVIP